MNLQALVAQARELHGALLTDAATLARQGPPTTDDLGTEIPTWSDVADVPALVQHVSRLASGDGTSGGEHVLVVDHVAKVPLETDVQLGDRITVTASLDPANLGEWFVSEVERQGWAITRRVHLERTWHSPSTPRS